MDREDALQAHTNKNDIIQSSAVAGRWISLETVPFSDNFNETLAPPAASLFHTWIFNANNYKKVFKENPFCP